MVSPPPANTALADAGVSNTNQTNTVSTTKTFEQTLLTDLEISPYDLIVLKRYLKANHWIPATTSEEAIEDAVFRFRETFEERSSGIQSSHLTFKNNPRLGTLFDV